MSNKGFKPVLGAGNGTRLVAFQILPNGASTPTIGENPDGVVDSVARTGAGTLTFTLNDKFLAVRGITCTPELATPAATLVVLSDTANVSSGTAVTVVTYQESAGSFAAADIAADAGNILHFTAVMRDSNES